MSESIRLLLVDDQRLMREGLRTLLELEEDLCVAGEAEDGAAALAHYAQLQPDVVLMDVRMPGMDGVEATRRLLGDWPDARVIILTTFDEDEYVFEGLRAGARGYLLKALSGEELATAIRTVHRGDALLDPAVTAKVMAEFARLAPPARPADSGLAEALSEREREILILVARGLTNREIAQRLYLAEGTIKNYVTNILQKIGVRDRTQAALRARELGFVS
jgi:DNA-binding NarL/FixJ family response regulator